jgi:hypothetical protein
MTAALRLIGMETTLIGGAGALRGMNLVDINLAGNARAGNRSILTV